MGRRDSNFNNLRLQQKWTKNTMNTLFKVSTIITRVRDRVNKSCNLTQNKIPAALTRKISRMISKRYKARDKALNQNL